MSYAGWQAIGAALQAGGQGLLNYHQLQQLEQEKKRRLFAEGWRDEPAWALEPDVPVPGLFEGARLGPAGAPAPPIPPVMEGRALGLAKPSTHPLLASPTVGGPPPGAAGAGGGAKPDPKAMPPQLKGRKLASWLATANVEQKPAAGWSEGPGGMWFNPTASAPYQAAEAAAESAAGRQRTLLDYQDTLARARANEEREAMLAAQIDAETREHDRKHASAAVAARSLGLSFGEGEHPEDLPQVYELQTGRANSVAAMIAAQQPRYGNMMFPPADARPLTLEQWKQLRLAEAIDPGTYMGRKQPGLDVERALPQILEAYIATYQGYPAMRAEVEKAQQELARLRAAAAEAPPPTGGGLGSALGGALDWAKGVAGFGDNPVAAGDTGALRADTSFEGYVMAPEQRAMPPGVRFDRLDPQTQQRIRRVLSDDRLTDAQKQDLVQRLVGAR